MSDPKTPPDGDEPESAEGGDTSASTTGAGAAGDAATSEAAANGEGAPDEEVEDEESGALPLAGLAALRKRQPAPEGFGESVEDKIRTRSAGRFFGVDGLADRRWVALLGLGIVVLGALVYLLMRNSDTGHLKINEHSSPPELAPGARDAVPKP